MFAIPATFRSCIRHFRENFFRIQSGCCLRCLVCCVVLPILHGAYGQERSGLLVKNSTFVDLEYSNTSSHFLIGTTQNRRVAGVEVGLSRRLGRTRFFDWTYDLAIIPVFFIQDPTATISSTYQVVGFPVNGPFPVSSQPIPRACVSSSYPDPNAPPQPGLTVTLHQECGTRWTYSGGLSPLGQRLNFLPGRRLEPLVLANAGFLVSTRDVPADLSSAFNFTFEFGTGLEWHQDSRRSWTIEYVAHHLSNRALGINNPGVDNQIIRVKLRTGR